jgi:ribosome-binding factor A
MAILADLKDPRIRDVTVTYVEVSGDLRHAKVHVSVMGDETRQQLSLRGLRSAAGYLQSKLSDRIDTRYTPRLEFILDQGVKRSIEIARILKEVLPEEPARDASDAETPDAEEPEDKASDTEAGMADGGAAPAPGETSDDPASSGRSDASAY